MTLAIVTATLDYDRAESCVRSWMDTAAQPHSLYLVVQGAGNVEWERIAISPNGWKAYGMKTREILGPVKAFAKGVAQALHDGADIVACLHDDLEITQLRGVASWDNMVRVAFKAPQVGLVGFGGATGLGAADIYQTPYHPMQLARVEFISNMRDAEVHGRRVERVRRVACLDGFSQIGRREFWLGQQNAHPGAGNLIPGNHLQGPRNLLDYMHDLGVIHHAYDSALGALAHRLGWETWYLPVACHHYGGRTAVGDPRYQEWAAPRGYRRELPDGTLMTAYGDAAIWERSHQVVYELLKGTLPIRIEEVH